MPKSEEIHIDSKNNPFDLKIRETMQYKDLIVLFIKRNFALTYKQTILGPAWLIIQPLANSLILAVVFGMALGISTDGMPQFLFYLCGTSIWGLFSGTLTSLSDTFLSQAYLFSKIYFPRLTIPISQAISGILRFLIQFALIIVVFVYYAFSGVAFHISLSVLLIPVLLIQAVLLAMGVGLMITSLTIKYRDLGLAVPFIAQVWMYLTPVVYSLSSLTGPLRTIMLYNPMTPIVNNFRYCLFGSGEFLTGPWAVSAIVTAVFLICGVLMFNRSEKSFIDII